MSFEDEAKRNFISEIQEIVDETGVTKDLAFCRWICENVLHIDDPFKVDAAVSIGVSGDYGVDIFHHESIGDPSENYVCWAQGKFSEDLDHSVTRDEMDVFGKTVEYLESCPSDANDIFKIKSVEFNSLGGVDATIKKRMIYAVTGKLSPQAQKLIDSEVWKQQIRYPKIEFEVFDLEKVLTHITTPITPTLKIKFDGKVISRNDSVTNKHSIIGYVKAKDLVDVAKKYGRTIFNENPRETLGKSTPTNKAISDTLNDHERKQKFWKLNNGVTATSWEIREITSSPGEYELDNFKVVNGRQTTYALENSQSSLDNVFLSMIIHEAVDPEERNLISQATNTQNPVKPIDLITNLDEMNNLVLQCKLDFKDFYFERQTQRFKTETLATRNRVTKRRVLEKNTTARGYYAYAIDPSSAMASEKDFFSVLDSDSYYYKVFQNRQIKDLVIPYIFMQMLKALYDKWKSELNEDPPNQTHLIDKEILSKEIVRYFILRFICLSMESLTDDEKIQIEQRIIKIFRTLGKQDPLPEEFLNIAQNSYNTFKECLNQNRNNIWDQEMLEEMNNNNYTPTAYDIMYRLKLKGEILLPSLINSKQYLASAPAGDLIKLQLLSLIPNSSSP